MTLFSTNLTFGPQSFLLHYLAQSALVGKVGYANLCPKDSSFLFAPIHTDDVASAVSSALGSGITGKFHLGGPEQASLRRILDVIEEASGRTIGAPMIPRFDYLWDFINGTSADLNMSRMIEFYESNPSLADQLAHNWHESSTHTLADFYKGGLSTEELETPSMKAYC